MKFFAKLWLDYLKPFWSRIRWMRKRKIEAVPCAEQATDIASIKNACSLVYKNFEWTMDDVSQFFDSYAPVEYLYNVYRNALDNGGEKIRDDCDGFHSVIYHILTKNNIPAVLLTIATKPLKVAHTMCLFKYRGFYYLVNYCSVKRYNYDTIDEIVEDYAANDSSIKKVHYWNMHEYDYEKNVFRTVKQF